MTDEQIEIDVADLDAMFLRIPSGPYSADARGESWEVRAIDKDPTNRHHWPYRLCESIRGQKAGCDPDVFGFIAGVINAWPSIRTALSASSVGESVPTNKHTAEDWKSLAMENERSVQHWIAKYDALSARLADAVQPAAGEGGLREALEPFAGLDTPEMDASLTDDEIVTITYGEWGAGPSGSIFTVTLGDLRRATAALSTSVPAGVVRWQSMETAPTHEEAEADLWVTCVTEATGELNGYRVVNAMIVDGVWSSNDDLSGWEPIAREWLHPSELKARTYVTHWQPIPAPPAQESTR